MPLRSTVSSLGKSVEPGEMPAAPAPRLGRRPGIYKSPPGAVDILSPDDKPELQEASEPVPTESVASTPTPQASKVKAARKPRAPKAVAPNGSSKPRQTLDTSCFTGVSADAKATRALIGQVEGDMIDLRAQMQKALAKFQPKLERLQARHAELSTVLVKQLTQ